jgi:hypothetical protein
MVGGKTKVIARKGVAAKPVTIKQVKKLIEGQIEHKIYTVETGALTASTAGSVSPITQSIILGDAIDQRTGNKVILKRYVFRINASIATNTHSFRYIMFIDTMANGAIPAATDLLEATGGIITPWSPFQKPNMQAKRFIILRDKVVSMISNGPNEEINHVVNLPLNRPVFYDAATSVPAANGKGSIFVLFIASAASSVTYFFSDTLVFTDA